MHRHSVALVGLIANVLVGACQPAPPASITPGSSAATTRTGSAGSASPASPPAASPLTPLLSLELASGAPVIGPDDGPSGYVYSLSAAAARDTSGRIVLYTVWFGTGSDGLPPVVTMSTSDDGRDWDVGTRSAFDLDIGSANPGPTPVSALQVDDGSWWLYGWSADDATGRAFSSWRASAPAPDGPWTLDSTTLLEAGPPGAWDSFSAVAASVAVVGEETLLWYEGDPPGSSLRGEVGLATSGDGLAFSKFDVAGTTDDRLAESDPVIPLGICGPETSVAIEQPEVQPTADGLVAVFFGTGQGGTTDVYGAVSDDGRSWRCGSPTAILRGSDIPGGTGLHSMSSTPLGDGRIGLIIESIAGAGADQHSALWWATVAALPN